MRIAVHILTIDTSSLPGDRLYDAYHQAQAVALDTGGNWITHVTAPALPEVFGIAWLTADRQSPALAGVES